MMEDRVQLSVAVGVVQVAVPVVVPNATLTVVLAGQALKTGAMESIKQGFVTTTLKEQLLAFPLVSVAV
jgi:ligand-binding sensor protein